MLQDPPPISLQEGLNLSDFLIDLTIVVSESVDKLDRFTQSREGSFPLLVRDTLNRYYLLVLILNGKTHSLLNLLGLADKILSIELSNELETKIEKIFYDTLNLAYKYLTKPQLWFVKHSYQSRPSNEFIKYRASADTPLQPTCFLFQITIQQLLDFYGTPHSAKLRVAYEQVQRLRKLEGDLIQANRLLFKKGMSPKEITNLGLPTKLQEKVLWKHRQIEKYVKLVEQERNMHARDCSAMRFNALNRETAQLWVVKCQHLWTANSLNHLKTLFDAIANLRDLKAIEQFRMQHKAMDDRLAYIQNSIPEEQRSLHIAYMQNALSRFVQYHQAVLDQKRFSSIKYLWEESIFLWKFRNNIYKKIAVFVLLTILASVQTNFILGFTIFLVGLIAINIRI